MLARDAMTSPVITVPIDMPCVQAAQLLVSHGFTGAPVVNDDGRLVGIVTEADLLRDRIQPGPGYRHTYRVVDSRTDPPGTVGQVMTTPVESFTPGADLADAAALMLEERIRVLPIVDGAQVVGIITRRDLLRAATRQGDDALRTLIANRLSALDPRDRWDVSVHAGVADIADHVDNPRERRAVERIATAVPGVVDAHARYEACDPF